MSSDDKNDGYKSIKASTPKTRSENQEGVSKPSWIGRKCMKIQKALGDFWVVGKYGFQLGGSAGLILGFLVGGFEAMRMKSIWPLPIAMFGSGMTFGSIFAISTVLRADGSTEKTKMEIVFYDQKEGIYKRREVPLFAYKSSGSVYNSKVSDMI